MNTQNWLQPQPPALVAVNLDPSDAAKNYRADVVVPALDIERLRARDGLDALVQRLREVRAEACRTLDRARAALPRRRVLRAARRRRRRVRHVRARLLDRRLPRLPPPAQAAVPDGLGHARLRLPRRARRRAGGHRPDRLDLGRRGVPVRLRRARDVGPGEDPADRRDRRRRRLRDAPPRPGAERPGDPMASTCTCPTSRPWPRASACARRRSRGSRTSSARRSPSTSRDAWAERARRAGGGLVPPPTTSPNWYRKAG